MKRLQYLIILGLGLLYLGAAQPALSASAPPAKIRVVATTQDLAAITRAVGGDKVDVFAIGKGNQDPHFVPPKPSYVLKLKNADLLVSVGMELDVWANTLLDASGNPKINRTGPNYVDASLGIPVIAPPFRKIDRSLGDVHPQGNPHYQLDPVDAKYMSLNIVNGLKYVDPADAAYFDAQRQIFLKALAGHLTGWMKEAEALKGVKVLTYHESWPYFERRFGLDIVGNVEPKPGIPPSPKYIAELIQKSKAQGVKFIITEPYYPRSATDTVARAIGVPVLVLPSSVGGAPGVDDYFQLFDYDLGAMLKALH